MSYFGIPIRNGLPIGLGSVAPLASGGGSPFSPLSLFSGGAPGAWYDPSDYSTLFQDSAGTTPVTAVEQPVGRILDKSGNGNHAFQSTSASRPVLSARYNLLTKTEQFDDAVWTTQNGILTANAAIAPNGTLTADLLTENATSGYHALLRGSTAVAPTAITVCVGISVKRVTGTRNAFIKVYSSAGDFAGWFDLTTGLYGGAVPTLSAPTAGGVINLGDGWFFCFVNIPVSTFISDARYGIANGSTISYTGDGTSSILFWGASIVPANQSSLPYQRVNTSTDYATTGFLPYLKFDGVDDSLSTNSISFTATDKMSVFAGARKLSDSPNYQVITELSVNAGSNNGAFLLTGTDSFTPSKYLFASKGTAALSFASTNSLSFSTPITNTLTGLSDISGDLITLRVNGVQVAQNTADQGTGNFGNYPLYIGQRGGTLFPLNGQIYSMIIVGKAVTASELTNTETYVNQKTGAY